MVVMAEAIEALRDVEALPTVVFVLLLIDETAEATCVLVFVFTPEIEAPSEDEAAKIFEFVVVTFAPTVAKVAPSELEAKSVCAFTAVVTLPVCVFVFAFTLAVPAEIAEANDVEAAKTLEFVVVIFVFAVASEAPKDELAFVIFVFAVLILVLAVFTFVPIVANVAPNEDDAFVTSDCTANEPELKPAPVRVRVAEDHTSVARVPKVVRERVPADQTAVATSVVRVPKLVSVLPV